MSCSSHFPNHHKLVLIFQAMSRELAILEKLKSEYTQNNMEQVYDLAVELAVNMKIYYMIVVSLCKFTDACIHEQ